jgi:succinyl-CoA synthetase alpha subunit
MSILVNKDTKVICPGITGKSGAFHARACIEYGTQVVAGVTPGRGGQTAEGVPVFDSVTEAVRETGANVSMIFVPAPFAADAVLEGVDAGLDMVACITEGIPASDMVYVMDAIEDSSSRLVGPNCPGVITPGECKMGIMPGYIHKPGKVGVVSRSGTLTYEAVWQLTERDIGQSTCIGIGGDPIIGTPFIEALELYEADPDTEAVVMIGEIGGTAEEEAADYIKNKMTKPVACFVAGQTAPPGRRMGHAGAIISGGQGTAADKIKTLQDAGAAIVESPSQFGEVVEEMLKG